MPRSRPLRRRSASCSSWCSRQTCRTASAMGADLTACWCVQDFVKLARWEDRGFYAQEQATEKAQRQLLKLVLKTEAVLSQPAAAVLAAASAAASQQQELAAPGQAKPATAAGAAAGQHVEQRVPADLPSEVATAAPMPDQASLVSLHCKEGDQILHHVVPVSRGTF